MANTPMITLRLLIFGRVQGVFFRESMRQQALALDIRGWVRNRNDGSVEAVVQGDAEAVAQIRAWANRGPDLARVERVVESPESGEFSGFARRPSV
jgi:acylphosphatase